MAVRRILTYPDPVLRRRAAPVKDFDDDLRRLVDDMAETMYEAPGIGLAANQVGCTRRVIVVDTREDGEGGLLVVVNPEIVHAQGEVTTEEGCLSVPEFFSNVCRYETLTCRGFDVGGKPFEVCASGRLAVVLQHEIDHLDGKLFVDRIGPVARDVFRRRWRKRDRREEA